MSGDEIREDVVLAAVKPLKTIDSLAESRTNGSFGSAASSEFSDLELLFQQHHDRIFRAAYRMTGSPADAEDVLQTVFLRVVRTREWVAAENPEAYFTRAAINASLDLLRHRKRSKIAAINDVENDASASLLARQTPETDQEDQELRKLIRDAVAKLGSTAAQMFALRYFEGLDNGEIARLMKTSALVVGVTLHRARARLRREIGTYLQKHSTAA
jgi:RNA polymerase sigma factor (sigma-70 family)